MHQSISKNLLISIFFCTLLVAACIKDPFTAFELNSLDPNNEVDNSEESKAVEADSSDIIGAWILNRYLVNGDNQVSDYAAMRLVLQMNGEAVIVQENRQFYGKWRLTNNAQSITIFMSSDIVDAQIWYKEWLIMALGKTELDLLNITENRQLRMELSRIPEIPML